METNISPAIRYVKYIIAFPKGGRGDFHPWGENILGSWTVGLCRPGWKACASHGLPLGERYPRKIRKASCFIRRSASSAWRSLFLLHGVANLAG